MFTIRTAQLQAVGRSHNGAVLASALAERGQQATWDDELAEVRATDARGHTTRCRLDACARLAVQRTPIGREFHYGYGPEHQLTELRSSQGICLTLDYYPRKGRLKSVRRATGATWTFAWTEGGDLSVFTYPDGSSDRFDYAGPGRVSGVTDGAGNTVHFDRDALDRITAFRDANGNRTAYTYAAWDRPDRITRADGSTEDLTRDAQGRLAAAAVNGSPWAEFAFDAEGRLTDVRFADGHFLAFVYDDAGRVIEARNPGGAVKRQYDDAGRLVAEDQCGRTVRYGYNELGALASLTTPDGETVRFGYDPDGRLNEVVDWAGGRHVRIHDAASGAVEHRHPNGVTTRALGPADGPRSAVTVHRMGSQRQLSLHFEYTANDRLAAVNDSEVGSVRYRYDEAGRVTASESVERRLSESFTYDPSGNRVRAGGTEASFDVLNQITRHGAFRLSYDARGNLTDASGARYHYNDQNLLTSAALPDGRRVEYTYDAFARRVTKQCGDERTEYVWAGHHLIGERVTRGGRTERRDYLFEPDTFTPLSMRVDGVVYQYHMDHRRVPRWLTDPAGEVAWSAALTAFGRTVELARRVRQPFRFAGQYHDEETGLHNNRARYYSPELGRYLSRDPLELASELNLYVYAGNDPVNREDPLGLVDWGQVGKGVGAALLGAAAVGLGIGVVAAAIAGTATVGVGILAAVVVVAGAALVGGGIAYALAPEGCPECQRQAFIKGALMGAGIGVAALLMMTPVGPTLLAVGGVGVATGAISTTAVMAAVTAAAVAVGATAGLTTGGGGGSGGDDDGGESKPKKVKAKDRRKAEQERAAEERGGRPTEGTPGNNQAQNREFDDAARGLNKGQQRQLHDEITKQNMTREQIIQRRNDMFPDNPYPGPPVQPPPD